ncbi:DUF664 domain-containing protein [Nonomuraea terrae]|uniref:mycothiol transferase n=1 Tax=Nonomuraea terrae TaxID=2530383 RepID=UPI0037BBF64C
MTGTDPWRGTVTLRGVPAHMIEEYARHNGDADYLLPRDRRRGGRRNLGARDPQCGAAPRLGGVVIDVADLDLPAELWSRLLG